MYHSGEEVSVCTKRLGEMKQGRNAEDVLCEVAWILTPLLRCTWSDLPHIAPAILFVSHIIWRAFRETMQNTIAYYPCSSLIYELHVHPTLPRHPGRTPQMPLHWVVRSDEHEHAMNGCVASLWRRSRYDSSHVHEDAWDVMPSLHDGSTGAYDFGTLLLDLCMGSPSYFYRYDVVPILHVVQQLGECHDRYTLFTYHQGLQRLTLAPGKKE